MHGEGGGGGGQFPCWEDHLLGEKGKLRHGGKEGAHRRGAGESGFPPLKIKPSLGEQGEGSRIGACPQGIKPGPSGKLAVPRGGDDAGDGRGRRVPRPWRCRTGAGGWRWPSQPGSAKANRKASGEQPPPYLLGEVIYCGSSEVGHRGFLTPSCSVPSPGCAVLAGGEPGTTGTGRRQEHRVGLSLLLLLLP